MSDSIRPVHYQLEIIPDLPQFRFSGRVTVDLETDQPVSRVDLNLLSWPYGNAGSNRETRGGPAPSA
jgi:hypothetical protein